MLEPGSVLEIPGREGQVPVITAATNCPDLATTAAYWCQVLCPTMLPRAVLVAGQARRLQSPRPPARLPRPARHSQLALRAGLQLHRDPLPRPPARPLHKEIQ